MTTTRLPRDFKEFLKSLNEQKVRYLLVGGYAVAYYGYPRTTADMDIWVAVETENAERVVAALRKFGFDVPGLSAEMFSVPDRVVRMGVVPMRIEILTSISGVEFDTCYNERERAKLDGIEVNLISLNRLKQNKQASGRHKDLDDLEHLP